MGYQLMVAEDDLDIARLLCLYLESAGYRVFHAENGVEALEIVKNEKIDLTILDLMMPRMDGYALTKKIREFSNMPIVILSAKDQDHDKILGLDLGADDYMTKPFNPMEIVARVRSNLRRYYQLGGNEEETGTPQKKEICVGELILDPEKITVSKNGEFIALTPTEYKILAKLMSSPGRVFAKSQLYESINGEFFPNDENTMMVHISKLREKIEDNPKMPRYIKTIRGIGYKIEP